MPGILQFARIYPKGSSLTYDVEINSVRKRDAMIRLFKRIGNIVEGLVFIVLSLLL